MTYNINLFDHIETRVERIAFALTPDGVAGLVLYRPPRDGKPIVFPVDKGIVAHLRELAEEADQHFRSLGA